MMYFPGDWGKALSALAKTSGPMPPGSPRVMPIVASLLFDLDKRIAFEFLDPIDVTLAELVAEDAVADLFFDVGQAGDFGGRPAGQAEDIVTGLQFDNVGRNVRRKVENDLFDGRQKLAALYGAQRGSIGEFLGDFVEVLALLDQIKRLLGALLGGRLVGLECDEDRIQVHFFVLLEFVHILLVEFCYLLWADVDL